MKGYKFKDPNFKLSKKLAWLLRHNAEKEGLKISKDGFVLLDDVLNYLIGDGWKDISFESIRQIVDTNDKKRYELAQKISPETEQKEWYIRATQGHSMNVVETEQLLKKIENVEDYPCIIHGTYQKFLPLIQAQGLKRMTRNHIHFAPGLPKQKGVISGMRGNCDAYVEVDIAAATKDGIHFYISTNNVVLTQGLDGVIPPKYFKNVIKF